MSRQRTASACSGRRRGPGAAGTAAGGTGAGWQAWTRRHGLTFPAALELGTEQVLMGLSLPVSGFINISHFLVLKYLLC